MNVEAVGVRATASRLPGGRDRWRSSPARLRVRYYCSLLLLDLACIFASFYLAHATYGLGGDQWLVVATVMAPVYVATALNARAYSADIIVRPHLGISRAAKSFALSAGLVVLIAFYFKTSADFSRGMVAIASTFGCVSLSVLRWWYLRHARALTGGNPYCVALISDGAHSLDVSDFSFVIYAGPDLDPEQDCPAMFNRLALALQDADRVVISCPPERRLPWVRMLKGASVRSELIAPELLSLAPLALDRSGEMPTLVIADGPLGKVDRLMKRAFDIAVSGAALLALAPLMIVIALLIKLDSRGPVFFVQTRIGQGNRLFRMLKFRSMRVEHGDSAGHRSAGRDDDRITPLGKFIRGTSIDELPQLINVLTGDMSIVGPRPHALGSRAEDKLFWEVDDRYWHRHAAKPGLTGLAQIRGFRGATERESDLTNRLHADLEYLHNWSLWRDMLIILQTFRVLVHRNAY